MPLDLTALLTRELGDDARLPDVDIDTMAMIIRGAIDSAAERRARDAEFDPRPYGNELAGMVEARLFPAGAV
ncbi:hypothetical protein GCM10022419_111400 [Nonomuraea rosea]|uniref:Uncharacterized protein n=2 Tax=Nonomuraea rosea TaxID=638574 RepID=A0ABP6ZFM3_9ACTN